MLYHHSGGDYGEAASEAAKHARGIFEKKLEEGKAGVQKTVEHVMNNVPQDFLAKGKQIEFDAGDGRSPLMCLGTGETAQEFPMTRYALGQVLEKAKFPTDYANRLLVGPDVIEVIDGKDVKDAWRADLFAYNLNQHYHKNKELAEGRHLGRAVTGKVHGFLSDRFRRIDDRPLVDTFIGAMEKVGAVLIEGTVTETRTHMKACLPYIFEPVPNEVMLITLAWGNSMFGAAKHTCGLGIWRLWCTNKAVMEDGLSAVHLGGRLEDSIELSQKTYELDTKTQISALHDVVEKMFSPDKVKALLQTITQANEKQMEWKDVKTKLDKALLKGELKLVQAAFESDDVVNLPPIKSVWRMSNAMSLIAGQSKDPDRRLQLERMAGALIKGQNLVTETAA